MFLRSTLLLSSLITLAACGDDGGGTVSDASTGNATPATTATTDPSTGDAPTSTGMTTDPTTEPATSTTEPATSTTEPATSTTEPATSTTGPATTDDTTDTTGEDTTTGLTGPSWAVDVYPVLNPPVTCDCHTPGSGGLKMGDAATAYMNLVGVPASKGMLKRVEPGDATKSFMWHKINGTQADVGGGSQMPLGAPALPQETIDLITEWIDGGAQP